NPPVTCNCPSVYPRGTVIEQVAGVSTDAKLERVFDVAEVARIAVGDSTFITRMTGGFNRTIKLDSSVARRLRIDKTSFQSERVSINKWDTLFDPKLRRPTPEISGTGQSRLRDGCVGVRRER